MVCPIPPNIYLNAHHRDYRYIVGVVDFLVGVIIFIILTLLLSSHRFGLRATRLPSCVFIFFGVAQFYAGSRGFCNQVWGRSSNQVKPWELDDVGDEEAEVAGSTRMYNIQAESAASDNLFTPMADNNVDLPPEVHPLTDLGGTVDERPSPLPWETASPPLSDDEPELSEAGRRQLAIRRATIKVPDATLAFPIVDQHAQVLDPATPFNIPPKAAQKRGELSPFDTDPDLATTRPDLVHPSPAANTTNQRNPSTAQDLTSLLVRFARFGPRDPQSSSAEKEIKVFGPERLVEDPRIKKLYEGIVRDILIVAGSMTAIWIVLCFAVPMRGLG